MVFIFYHLFNGFTASHMTQKSFQYAVKELTELSTERMG
jgi:hypothetical protein